jgi:hypothetical protein
MDLNITFLFRQQTNKKGNPSIVTRTGSWSESWWFQGSIADARNAIFDFAQSRTRILTTATQISGIRIRIKGGGSSVINQTYRGALTNLADLPQVGVQVNFPSLTRPNVRRMIYKGITDGHVVEGEFIPSAFMEQQMAAHFKLIATIGFKFYGRDLSQARIPVESLTTTGLLTFKEPQTFATNARLRFLRVKDDNGKPIKGVFRVSAGVNNISCQLADTFPVAAHTGQVRLDLSQLCDVDGENAAVGRATTHKVGRDFFSFRGRASKRQ